MAKTKVKNVSKRLLTVSIPPAVDSNGKRKKGSKPDSIYFLPKDVKELTDSQMEAPDIVSHLKSGRLTLEVPKANTSAEGSSSKRRRSGGDG